VGASTIALPGGVQEIALGAVMILILMFRPAGIMGNSELTGPRPGRKDRATGNGQRSTKGS
jgi:branched-chain amino acid transport system permease protein